MAIIKLIVNCANCDAEIIHESLHLGIDGVNIDEFCQTDWYCFACGHRTIIGDIEPIDEEDLFDDNEHDSEDYPEFDEDDEEEI